MYAQFRYLDGPRTGETRVPKDDFAIVGRHPTAHVPFDPATDLQVSVKHAAVFKQGGNFMIRDLGSTNGTFLDGKRVRGDLPLESGNILQFGPVGPKVEFTIASTLPAETRAAAPAPEPRDLKAEIFGPRTARPTERFPASGPVQRPTGTWKWVVAAAVVAVLAYAGVTRYRQAQHAADLARRGEALQRRLDGLIAILQRPAAAGPFEGELRQALTETNQLRGSIQQARLDTVAFDDLSARIGADSAAHARLLRAAAFDPAAAARPSGPGVVVVAAEFPNLPVRSGSGVAVRSRADTVWVVTATSLVSDAVRPTALVVIYNGFRQSFRAVVTATDSASGLSLLAVVIRGGASVVKGLADDPPAAPLAALGFPFGLDSLGDWRATGTKAVAGTVSAAAGAGFTLDRHGFGIGPGMALVDSAGIVVGMVVTRDGKAAPGRAIRRLLPPG